MCGDRQRKLSPVSQRVLPELKKPRVRVTPLKQKEPRKVLKKLKHYVFPQNPLDGRALARLKRGAIHYAQVNSWWPWPPLQRWIRRQRFHFRHGANGSQTRLAISGS